MNKVIIIFLILISGISHAGEKEMENYALYSQLFEDLPEENIKDIANPDKFSVLTLEDNTKSFVYEWNDLKVTINKMPKKNLPAHLKNFAGYVQHLSDKKRIKADKKLIARILNTTMVLGIIIEPSIDKDGRAEEILGAITYNTNSLMFYSDSIYDENAQLLLGP